MLQRLKVVLMAMIMTTLCAGMASAYEGAVNEITIYADGEAQNVRTAANTVADVLEELGLRLQKDDAIAPGLNTAVTDGMEITIDRAFLVTAYVDHEPHQIRISGGTIQDAVDRVESDLGIRTKLVEAKPTTKLTANMDITLITTFNEIHTEETAIPFETEYVENDQVEEGVETVLSEGIEGVLATTYECYYEGSELISKNLIEEKIAVAPVNQVIEVGAKRNTVPGTKLVFNAVHTMRASAYTSDKGDAGTHTCTGERARVGLVAVDPKFIPLGTRLYVEGYGECRAADTGGMIKGNAIDLFFNTYEECVNFGRRELTVYVLE